MVRGRTVNALYTRNRYAGSSPAWGVFVDGKRSLQKWRNVFVCSNCHREVHAGLLTIPDDVQRFDESLIPSALIRTAPYSEHDQLLLDLLRKAHHQLTFVVHVVA